MRPPAGRGGVVLLLLAALLVACGPRGQDEPTGADAGEVEHPAESARPPAPGEDAEAPAAGRAGDEADDGAQEPAEQEPEPPEPAPVRGAWVHLFDDALKTRAGIVEVVDELADAGATTIVAQVARRWDAYYESKVLPRTPDPRLEDGLDVLATLLDTAHARGLEVHAWITVAPTWHHVYEDLPRPDGWLPPAHGHRAPEEHRWVTRTVDGEWSEYLDPALPEVQRMTAAVAAEIVRDYPVDGLHLDYVRYASERHGYHPRALERYHEETGATGTPEPADPAWSDWRRARTRELLEHVAGAVADADPRVALSAAVIAWGEGPGGPATPGFEATRSYREALQDWPGWARDGLVDVLMPMVYFREDDEQQARWFAQWTAYQADLNGRTPTRIVPGVGGWLNRPEATLDQTLRSAAVGDGAMVYSYQQPTADESREVLTELRDRGWGVADGPG
jgi:uncharacterized lipoprotein YddW (UPF0748 family)